MPAQRSNFATALPMSAAGKIVKAELRAKYWEGQAGMSPERSPWIDDELAMLQDHVARFLSASLRRMSSAGSAKNRSIATRGEGRRGRHPLRQHPRGLWRRRRNARA
jgi:hypothetical protein